jgi:hypothetical protein
MKLNDFLLMLQTASVLSTVLLGLLVVLVALLVIAMVRFLFRRKEQGGSQYQRYKKEYDTYQREQRKKQRKAARKKIVPVVLVMLALVVVGATALIATGKVDWHGINLPEISVFQPASPSVGDTASADGVEITLIDAVESTGTELIAPSEGEVYLVLKFDIANHSGEEITISPLTSFSAYADDYKIDMSIFGTVTLPELQDWDILSGSIADGKKLKGGLCYSVPEDWQTFEISIATDWLSDEQITFTVNKENLPYT